MLKVFLVEDEFVVREGIKNNIDWREAGFTFCGDAPDGEIAYPLIQEEQPDIIITDIKMPFMDGLDLCRLVKKELPQCRAIILSGHGEFSYAQEAIKIGVTEYLLKPINGAELIKAVKRVGDQIIQERIEKENFERYKVEMEENEIDARRKFFDDLISGSLSIMSIIERGKELGLELSAQYYQIILFKYYFAEDVNYSGEISKLSKELREINNNYSDIILFERAIEGVALLIKGNSLEQLESTYGRYIDQVKAIMSRYPGVHYFGGIGTAVRRLKSLLESFESAARAFSHRFITNKCLIINCNELSICKESESSDYYKDMMELSSVDMKKVEAFLRNGEIEEVVFFVEEFVNRIVKASEKSILFRQYFIINMYLTVIGFIKEIGMVEVLGEEPFLAPESVLKVVDEMKRVSDYVVRILTITIKQRDIIRTKGYNRLIEQAKEYINNHYANENISLNETAAYLNISASHFSMVFSRESGKSFIRYLTDLRMNKAKELLKCSDLRCAEIGMAVGYKDPHYFSYLFKKAHNCSPMQYRALKK